MYSLVRCSRTCFIAIYLNKDFLFLMRKICLDLPSLGPKVYFPNLVFTMIRSGKTRTPNTHVFRIPSFLTKMDVKNYLERIYGVAVKSVSMANFLGRSRTRFGGKPITSKKNAIVEVFPSSGDPNSGDAAVFKFPPPPPPDQLKYPTELRNSRLPYPVFHKK